MIKVYGSETCIHCTKLMSSLDKLNLKYKYFDVDDFKNKNNVDLLFNLIGESAIPIIIYGKHLLAPKKSFNTIEQAVTIIQTITK